MNRLTACSIPMAIETNPEESAGEDSPSLVPNHLQEPVVEEWLTSLHQSLWSLVCSFLSLEPVKENKRQTETKVNFEDGIQEKDDIGQQSKKLTIARKMYRKKHLFSALQRFWLIYLSVSTLWLPLVSALQEECTLWKRDPNDATLDVFDVNASLSVGGVFNGTNGNYTEICPDAFAHSHVTCIVLSNNNITYLPGGLCKGVTNLKEMEFQFTQLTEFPPALNDCKTVQFLNLASTKITDVPEQSIIGMKRLTVLDLSRTEITCVPQVVFKMPYLRIVHLSHTKLVCLPLPLPSSDSFNVTLSGDNDNELTILFTDSGRKMGINITEIDTLICENAKAAVAKSYNVLAGEILCDNGSFKKIDILLSGNPTSVPTYETPENSKDTLGGDVPSRGASTPRLHSCRQNTILLALVLCSIFAWA